MAELKELINSLQSELDNSLLKINFADLKKQKHQLDEKITDTTLWDNGAQAQSIMKDHVRVSGRLEPWIKLKQEVDDIISLADLKDAALTPELQKHIVKAQKDLAGLNDQLKLSDPLDEKDAIITISAGAGGTDAQDWASILLRMYIRWAEKNNRKVINLYESLGEEAGIKSSTIEIVGDFSYGYLKGESGVHRLVRLSPFNSDNLRQTSFAKVEIIPKIDKPGALEIDEKDLKVDVYRSGGHGGQSVNTTDSAVRVTHVPTGITVSIQNERSQLQNKETALTILRSKLVQLQQDQHQQELKKIKGPNQSAEWGNQIRSYVLHPYKQIKDLRTDYQRSDTEKVLDGDINGFLEANLDYYVSKSHSST